MAEGDTVELDKVLLIADDDKATVGTPTVEGAKVIATSQGEGKGKKIIVFKYKPKVRYRKKMGHRQFYTRLAIEKIISPETIQSEPVKKVRRHTRPAIDKIVEPEPKQDEPARKVRRRKREVTESGT